MCEPVIFSQTMKFDYIVVGAGSAGSVVANRLTENGRHSVLVLEAGPSDQRFYVQVPLGYGKVYYDKNINWKYETEAIPGLANRSSYWPRGKVLGGSSSINAMVYVRGHPNDFCQWNGHAKGWAWEQVEPVYRRIENWHGTDNHLRGTDGPLHVQDITTDAHPICNNYLQAAAECQIAFNADYNSEYMEGASLYQITTHNGLRASSARCYLHPAKSRHNLCAETNAVATRVLFSEKRAIGIEYEQAGIRKTAHARAEIILCGGAINSPQLLQLSGVGDTRTLAALNINTIKHNAHVGQHLQDHLGGDMVYQTTVPTLNQTLGPWHGKLKAGLQFLLNRSGPLTLSLNQAGGFIKTDPNSPGPDLQLYFSPVSYTRAPVGTRPLIKPDPFPGFLIGFNPCKPSSEGWLSLKSNNPHEAPTLQPNYLSTDHDQQLMLKGMRLMRRLTAAPSLKQVISDEIYPGVNVDSDAELMQFVRENAWTVFHQCGTCRMGDDADESVVNAKLQVHGLDGLRVADASIFPTIPTGNTNAPAIMVGERAAELILQDAR